MFRALKTHPFGVEAFFRRSLVLTYALPVETLAGLIGPGLEVDAYDGSGFLAIAMVETRDLRPKGLPRWMGRDFFLSGYRIFTRFVRPGQQTLRGLRILRSDTDRRTMASLGNLFTSYNYRLAKVDVTCDAARLHIVIRTQAAEADLDVTADLETRPAPLPEGSPFRSMTDARSFAGPLPYTFHFDPVVRKMVVIRGLRQAWDPQPVSVSVKEASFLESGLFGGAQGRLANAFYLEDVPYSWKPGTLEAIA
jgi:hypothetical protein